MRGRKLLSRVFVAAVATAAVACAIACSSPSTPSPAQVAGVWGGTTDAPHETLPDGFAILITVSQLGTSLSDTWLTGTSSSGVTGTLTGTVNGANVTMQMTNLPPLEPCVW